MSRLTTEERAISDAFDAGQLKSIKNVKKEIAKYQKIATTTLKKDKRINIRISTSDLNMIRRRAVEEGLPYQTLIASVLHKFASGTLTNPKL